MVDELETQKRTLHWRGLDRSRIHYIFCSWKIWKSRLRKLPWAEAVTMTTKQHWRNTGWVKMNGCHSAGNFFFSCPFLLRRKKMQFWRFTEYFFLGFWTGGNLQGTFWESLPCCDYLLQAYDDLLTLFCHGKEYINLMHKITNSLHT